MKKIAFAFAACIAATSISANAAEKTEKGVELKQLVPGTTFTIKSSDGSTRTETIKKMEGISIWLDTVSSRGTDSDRESLGFTVGLGKPLQEKMTESERAGVTNLFPLKVGNKASFGHSGVRNGYEQWATNDKAEVLSKETVTVPAGTFETFVIATSMQRTDYKWQAKNTCWYSPEVGYCVKRRWESFSFDERMDVGYELVSVTVPQN